MRFIVVEKKESGGEFVDMFAVPDDLDIKELNRHLKVHGCVATDTDVSVYTDAKEIAAYVGRCLK